MSTPIQPDGNPGLDSGLEWTLDWTGLDWIRRVKAFLLIPTLCMQETGSIFSSRVQFLADHLIAVRE